MTGERAPFTVVFSGTIFRKKATRGMDKTILIILEKTEEPNWKNDKSLTNKSSGIGLICPLLYYAINSL